MKKILKYSILPVLLLFTSCNEFLDELPDDRTAVDSKAKVRKLLVSAYPSSGIAYFAELATDNIVDEGDDNPNSSPIMEEMAYWKDVTLTSNDDIKTFWAAYYSAIASSNLALLEMDKLEVNMKGEKAEALITRAFSHFLLVNVFAKHYNPATAANDLGITYMGKSETTLNPKYKRNSVAEVYKLIEADIEAALPNITDDTYDQPKYHFNKKAAYAFAAKFYLYYGKWDKSIECANKALSGASLIDWAYLGSLSSKFKVRAAALIQEKGSLMLLTSVSSTPNLWGPFYAGTRLNHTRFVSERETVQNYMPWGQLDAISSYNYKAFAFSGTNYKKVNFPKIGQFFEVIDPVAGIGYPRAVYNMFTTDETYLIRAEAQVHLENYSAAIADLNTWSSNFFKGNKVVTQAEVNTFYNAIPYSKPSATELTQKKKLSPVHFIIKNVDQENMFHYVLQCRRLATLHEGLRWFDIKRFGIEVPRLKEKEGVYELAETLVVGDNRRAMQLPLEVIESGLTPNPR